MSAIRRDDQGRLQVDPPWESLADRLIREAHERGEFDVLPFRGKPLPRPDDAYAGEMAMAFSILRNAGAAPPWIEADMEVRSLLAERDALHRRARLAGPLARSHYRREMRRIVEQHDRAIAVLNAEAPTVRQHRLPLDEARELEALDASG